MKMHADKFHYQSNSSFVGENLFKLCFSSVRIFCSKFVRNFLQVIYSLLCRCYTWLILSTFSEFYIECTYGDDVYEDL